MVQWLDCLILKKEVSAPNSAMDPLQGCECACLGGSEGFPQCGRAPNCFAFSSQMGVLVGALFPCLTSYWSSWCPAYLLCLTLSCLWNTLLCSSLAPRAGGSTPCLQHRSTSGLMTLHVWGVLCSAASDLSFLLPVVPSSYLLSSFSFIS